MPGAARGKLKGNQHHFGKFDQSAALGGFLQRCCHMLGVRAARSTGPLVLKMCLQHTETRLVKQDEEASSFIPSLNSGIGSLRAQQSCRRACPGEHVRRPISVDASTYLHGSSPSKNTRSLSLGITT